MSSKNGEPSGLYDHCVSRLNACHHDRLNPIVLSKMRHDSCRKCNLPDILKIRRILLRFMFILRFLHDI